MSSANIVKYNIKNVHAAVLTKGSDGTFSYAEPKPIPGAVSLSLDAEGDSSPFYADGIVYFRTNANNGYSGDFEMALIPEWFRTDVLKETKDDKGDSSPFYADGIVYFRTNANNGYSGDFEMALIPEWFRTDVLKETKDDKGVLVENSSVAETARFALLFEFDGDVNSIRHVLYNCSATRPSIESQTKEDKMIDPVTEKITISADPREDGLVKAKTGDTTDQATYDGWYKSVYVPTVTVSKPAASSGSGTTTSSSDSGNCIQACCIQWFGNNDKFF